MFYGILLIVLDVVLAVSWYMLGKTGAEMTMLGAYGYLLKRLRKELEDNPPANQTDFEALKVKMLDEELHKAIMDNKVAKKYAKLYKTFKREENRKELNAKPGAGGDFNQT